MSVLAIKNSIYYQEFHIFASTQKNTGKGATVNCQNKGSTWALLDSSKESSSTPPALDSCQVHIDVLGTQHLPNTFTLHEEMEFITCSESHITVNNTRLLRCHISGIICTGFPGARLLACNQLTREHSSYKLWPKHSSAFPTERTEWVWWSEYSF